MPRKVDGLEAITAVHAVLRESRVPSDEVLNLSIGEFALGQCLSVIGLITTTDQHPEEEVWLSRSSGQKLCALRFLASDEYEIIGPLKKIRVYWKGGATRDMEGEDLADALHRAGYEPEAELTVEYEEEIE